MNTKVSVVIPTCNRAEKVCKGIESVLAQSFTDLEVIVVDDGSWDNTGQVLKNIFGDRIRYCFQSNQGASIARNRGAEEARGEWIAFLDSDDLWESHKVECQFKALSQFGPCYTESECSIMMRSEPFSNWRQTIIGMKEPWASIPTC